MKLKKIASLMLAGVMAVSMLAGCSNNGGNNNNNNNEDPVVNTGMAGKVIAALDGDTTKNVAFSASNSLETVLEKAVKDAGVNFDDLTAADLNAIDGDLSTDARLPFVWGTEGNDKKEQSITVVYYLNGFGVDESWAVQKLAEFFRRKAEPEAPANVQAILERINGDLSERYPAASDAASMEPDRGALRALVWSEKVTRMLQSLLRRYQSEGERMLALWYTEPKTGSVLRELAAQIGAATQDYTL